MKAFSSGFSSGFATEQRFIFDYIHVGEPRLLLPNVKPANRSITVDRDNYYGKHCVVCMLYLDENWSGAITNYAEQRNPGTIRGTSCTKDPYRFSEFGTFVELHPAGGSNGIDIIELEIDDVIENEDDITMLSIVEIQNNGTLHARFGSRGAGSDSFRLTIADSSTLRASYVDSSPAAQHDSDISVSISIGDMFLIVGRKIGNRLKLYTMKDSLYGDILESTETIGGSGNMRDDGDGNHIYPTGPGVGHVHISTTMVFKKGFEDQEVYGLMRDVYQVIRPI